MSSASEFLAYDDKLISACEAALRQYWHKSNLQLTRKPKAPARIPTFYSVIKDPVGGVNLMEDRANEVLPLPVLPIHPFIPKNSFYFGLRLRFDHQYESTYALTSASLSIFEGQDLSPVVRAEWDRRDIGNSNHAQPHWHLLGNSPTNTEAGFNAPGEASEPIPFRPNSSPRADIARVHFPSSAAWQAGRPATVQHPFRVQSNLVDWLSGLGEYMGDQLRHISLKKPEWQRDVVPISEFVPIRAG